MNQIAQGSPLATRIDRSCYHCGDVCDGKPITIDEKQFCCEGCKLVYALLSEYELDNYYQLNEAAGTSRRKSSKGNYSFLDDPETMGKLLEFTDGKQSKVRFFLPQIHCSSCLWLLEHLYRLHPGILRSRVDFLKREVSITYAPTEISLQEVAGLLDKIGYPPLIQLNDLEAEKRPEVDKSLYYKLGLAGFAFGNIMLLSFPEYLGLDPVQNPGLSSSLSYLNILLIIPVLVYSGRDYFIAAWQGLRQRHLNIDLPVSLGILALFFRSIYEILSHSGAGYLDSLAGLIFFLLIGKWFQQKTYGKITFDRDYRSYFPIAATLKQGTSLVQVTLDKLKKGDQILVRHGELIPADGLLSSKKAKIDYSFVSGESDLVDKKNGDQLFAGGRQMGGQIEIAVTKKVSNSYLTQLWNDQSFSKSKKSEGISGLADRVAGFFTATILIIAFGTLFYWLPKDAGLAINAFTAVLIVACPCAVALSIPFTFGNVIRLFGGQGIYLKNIQVIEALTAVKHIVFDKTGTITQAQSSRLSFQGSVLSTVEKQWITSLAKQSIHPLSQQVAQAFGDQDQLTVSAFQEFEGQGIQGQVGDHLVRIGSKNFVLGEDFALPDSKASVFVSINDNYIGAFQQHSVYRQGLKQVLNALSSWSTLSLLSGDNDREKKKLGSYFDANAALQFFQKPEQKLAHIKALQKENAVAMIGDGLNDAGALNESSVGIVITENTSNFTPACDIILDARQFEKLPLLFSFARTSIRLVYVAYGIALLYNIIGLSYAVQGALSPVIAAILMPLSSLTIVIFGVGTSTWLAYRKGLIDRNIGS